MDDLIRAAIVDIYPTFSAGLAQSMSKSKSVTIVAEAQQRRMQNGSPARQA